MKQCISNTYWFFFYLPIPLKIQFPVLISSTCVSVSSGLVPVAQTNTREPPDMLPRLYVRDVSIYPGHNTYYITLSFFLFLKVNKYTFHFKYFYSFFQSCPLEWNWPILISELPLKFSSRAYESTRCCAQTKKRIRYELWISWTSHYSSSVINLTSRNFEMKLEHMQELSLLN